MQNLITRSILKTKNALDVISKLKPGDIILTSRDSMIVKFMSLFQNDPVKWGHALVVRDANSAFEASFLIRVVSLNDILKKRKHYIIIRHKKWTEEHTKVINKVLGKLVGELYSFRRIFLQVFDHIFGTNWFSRLDKSSASQVCSTLVAYGYYVAMRYKFNDVSWRACDPDDIDDDYKLNRNNWEFVAEK